MNRFWLLEGQIWSKLRPPQIPQIIDNFLGFFSDSLVLANSQGGQQLQCYACGLPKVHPEYDVVGSYGLKKYNHSCEEMLDSKKNNNQIDQAFIRTCPVGVKSCFGATGFYDHKDNDKTNDICKYSF